MATLKPVSPSTAGRGGHHGKDQHNLLRVSTRSKNTETHVDTIRASYPLKLVSTKSTRHSATAKPVEDDTTLQGNDDKDKNSTVTATSQKPIPPPARIIYMIAYGGGLLKDDHPHLQIELSPLSRLLILGQGSTKISKCPSKDYPPASQTIHATVGPGAVYLFLGPPVVASEDSSAFLKHEILLQAAPARPPRINSSTSGIEHHAGGGEEDDDDEYDTLPSCVALDWIAGGRGEEERWKARRIEWRMVVRWAELEDWPGSPHQNPNQPESGKSQGDKDNKDQEEQEGTGSDDEYIEEEDPRDVADRLAGGPVIFRDGFLLEDDDTCPTPHHPNPNPNPAQSLPPSPQFSTSYAASIHPHSTIGTLFVTGPKTERLQRAILRRFEKMTVFPGQKASVRPDYPILWSATSIQIPRPKPPSSLSNSSSASRTPRTRTKANMTVSAVVVKMATQGVEQMQDFIKTLFEEKNLEDTSHFQEEQGSLSVVDELFGGRVVWDRAFR
ncbi:hypothetical protein BGZ73_009072 [Actinomortierella ambigua]|nr:hypothetical protein BGZ73_009072 [Actinomortierella ambigua]